MQIICLGLLLFSLTWAAPVSIYKFSYASYNLLLSLSIFLLSNVFSNWLHLHSSIIIKYQAKSKHPAYDTNASTKEAFNKHVLNYKLPTHCLLRNAKKSTFEKTKSQSQCFKQLMLMSKCSEIQIIKCQKTFHYFTKIWKKMDLNCLRLTD